MAPIPRAARAVFNATQHGSSRVTVLHYWRTDGWDMANLEALNIDLMLWWNEVGRFQMPDDMTLLDITTTALDNEPNIQDTLPCTSGCQGTRVEQPEPGNVTGTVSWRTASVGRSFRGRSYLPGFCTGDTNDDDTISSTRLVGMLAWAANLIWYVTDGTVQLGVLSRKLNEIHPVTGWVIENVLDSMRRRLPKRGS
jgi:hypothetical protein